MDKNKQTKNLQIIGGNKSHVKCYQDMDNIDMYGPSIYSKEVHSNLFREDTLKSMNFVDTK